jgi:lipoic acid synthetase
MKRLPLCFKQEIPGRELFDCLEILKSLKVNTVCQSSHCPNLTSCFKKNELTFMILGNICTRSCAFCAVDKERFRPLSLDLDEAGNVREAVKRLGLKYVVITSVTRDDLPDAGASQFRKTIEALYQLDNSIKIEVLIPDFNGSIVGLRQIVKASPDVIGHNLETVERLYSQVRPDSSYVGSLRILKTVKELDSNMVTKSSLILGMGEKRCEVLRTIEDLFSVNTDILIFGQYLAPSERHYPVKEFLTLERFGEYRDFALKLGIKAVLSLPLARSSYQAERLYREATECMISS